MDEDIILSLLESATFDNTPPFTLAGTTIKARVLDVYDGDTMTVALPWKGTCYRFKLRLLGINTEELRGVDAETKERALKARDRVLDLVTCGEFKPTLKCTRKVCRQALAQKPYLVSVQCHDFDKYGRVLARVLTPGSQILTLSDILVQEGLAREYMVTTKTD
jgi:endonuclease YncB( thermonuclease family)